MGEAGSEGAVGGGGNEAGRGGAGKGGSTSGGNAGVAGSGGVAGGAAGASGLAGGGGVPSSAGRAGAPAGGAGVGGVGTSGAAGSSAGSAGASAGSAGTSNVPTLCDACEQECRVTIGFDAVAACVDMPGVASAGGGKDLPLGQLCADVVSCFLETGCSALGDPLPCYCDPGVVGDCSLTMPSGACVREMQWAAESNDFGAIQGRFTDSAYALGPAIQLIDCYNYLCPGECYAP